MNKRLEPRGIRPSEDIIRRRLVERRLAHELAQDKSGWFSRAKAGRQREGRMLGGRLGRRPSLTTRLRERPVVAFLAATIVGIAIIGAIGSILRLDTASSGGGRAFPQIASTDASPQASGRPRSVDTPALDANGSDEISVGSTTRTARDDLAASRPQLRETTGALPPSVATAPGAAQARSAMHRPVISNSIVAAALALRLPQDAEDHGTQIEKAQTGANTAAASPLQPDLLTTTGSITRAVTEKPVAPEQLAGELQEQAAALEPDASSPATIEATAAATASVTANVNLRAKPDNDATILAVLPKGRTVTVENCDQWCEVSADGQSGYIFKSFVANAG